VEPNTVLIRGLPDITTTLNNRQIFSSSSRSISLPDFPAELLARVDVKKSSSADDIEGVIAGLINVTLHKPLDFPGLQIAGGVKATHGSLSKKWAPNANILLSNRWDTDAGEFGILANASYQKRLVSQDVVRQNQWNLTRCGVPGVGTGPASVPAGCMANTNIVTLTQADTQIERKALNASAQYRSNSGDLELFIDYFYADLKNQAPVDVNVLLLGTCPNPLASSPFPRHQRRRGSCERLLRPHLPAKPSQLGDDPANRGGRQLEHRRSPIREGAGQLHLVPRSGDRIHSRRAVQFRVAHERPDGHDEPEQFRGRLCRSAGRSANEPQYLPGSVIRYTAATEGPRVGRPHRHELHNVG